MAENADSSAPAPRWNRWIRSWWRQPPPEDPVADPLIPTTSYPVEQVRARLQDPQWAGPACRGGDVNQRGLRFRPLPAGASGTLIANQRHYPT